VLRYVRILYILRTPAEHDRVQTAARAVIDQITKTATSNSARIFSEDLFVSALSPTIGVGELSRRDLSVLLVHLARDHAAIAYDQASSTIKFRKHSETRPPIIEAEDIGIASLRSLIASLETQVEVLTKQMTRLDTTAREAVAAKKLTSAKTALRQKKLIDGKLQQRAATLTQLEEVYAKIEQAADQVEMVRVMQASGQALRSLNQKTGGVERVQDVMEGLKDEMMNVDEIQQAINEPSMGDVDETEVEDELEALEKMEMEKIEAAAEAKQERKEPEEAEEAERTMRRLAELDSPGTKEDHGATGAQERPAALEVTPALES
jgi:charged multivesicular body protein 7